MASFLGVCPPTSRVGDECHTQALAARGQSLTRPCSRRKNCLVCREHILSTYCVSGRWASGARAPSRPPECQVRHKPTFIQLTHGPVPGSVQLGVTAFGGGAGCPEQGPQIKKPGPSEREPPDLGSREDLMAPQGPTCPPQEPLRSLFPGGSGPGPRAVEPASSGAVAFNVWSSERVCRPEREGLLRTVAVAAEEGAAAGCGVPSRGAA